MINLAFAPTSDKTIRAALMHNLERIHENNPHARIVEELGITHGAARVDVAVINGSIHGYELKSDVDTLRRLPEQMDIYNSVLDEMTLVVGKSHLHEAIKVIPEWWGIMVAKVVEPGGTVSLYEIREAEKNPQKDSVAMASLLWREEALRLLEEIGQADGIRSKTRQILYERLASVLNQEMLGYKVRSYLFSRVDWRVEPLHMQYGG